MSPNAPYYQDVAASDQKTASAEFDLVANALDCRGVTLQNSMYPEPLHNREEYAQPPDAIEHAQLHELVEAASSAAAHEQLRQQAQQAQQADYSEYLDDDLVSSFPQDHSNGKRKRSSISLVDGDGGQEALDLLQRSKRQKRSSRAGPLGNAAQSYDAISHQAQMPDSAHLVDARAVGVHSAAALFRPASDLSKKYTRPPMSKLYTSLNLAPENFLYLQAAAKKYMLDPDYPERIACVGNKAKGDIGEVRLKLNQCVWDFLQQGIGDNFFNPTAPTMDTPKGMEPAPDHHRQFSWPRDKQKIVTLCTPLLRRMVTNERQRQYAFETRKGAKGDDSGQAIAQTEDEHSNGNGFVPTQDSSPVLQIYLLNESTKRPLRQRIAQPLTDNIDWVFLTDAIQRQAQELNQFAQLAQLSTRTIAFESQFSPKVLTSRGLVDVGGDDEWRIALQDVRQTSWLDGVVKVVVDCQLS